MDSKISLFGLSAEEIFSELGLSAKFRARQVFSWIYKGISNFDEMKNIDSATRNILKEKACLYSSSVSQVLKDPDGTIKLQITLNDKKAVETVLLTDREGRKTACVSCQAGCPMKCAFCQTGHLGFSRNLTAGEIIEEFMFLEKEAGKLDNIVFMGMGEPMLNLDAIRKAIALLSDAQGRGLSTKRITLSTCGITKGIYDLADNGPKIRLAISLTSANEELRNSLMPVNISNPLAELKKAIAYYIEKTGKRVTLEAALMHEKNTSLAGAKEMIAFAKGLDVYVNLIPWNPVASLDFTRPSYKECESFLNYLKAGGINAGFRMQRGNSIAGACGQLGKVDSEEDF